MVLAGCALLGAGAVAGLFPIFLKQVPRELHGDYFLLLRVSPDRTKQVFTNPPPFATIGSNQIALASGTVRAVERVMRVTQKGTNVYLFSFADESSWTITTAGSPDRLVVLEPNNTNSRSATMLVISRDLTNDFPSKTPSVP